MHELKYCTFTGSLGLRIVFVTFIPVYLPAAFRLAGASSALASCLKAIAAYLTVTAAVPLTVLQPAYFWPKAQLLRGSFHGAFVAMTTLIINPFRSKH